jgi:uncharacterized OB-fold protein
MNVPETKITRPDPIPSVDGAFFWKAAAEGRFVAKKCGGCGSLWHPPRPICPKCLGVVDQEHELCGRGTVVSWTMPIHPPAMGFSTPPIVVLVEIEEGLRFVSNVEGVAPQDMRVGLPVTVAFAETRSGAKVPVFRPAEER